MFTLVLLMVAAHVLTFVLMMQKRSYFDKALKQWKFKGSVFVTFPTREEAESFLAIGSVKFAGNELIKKWQ